MQPTSTEANESYYSASQYWNCEAHVALRDLNSGLRLERFELRNMLGRVPPLPDRATYGLIERLPLESRWHITGSKDCEASGMPVQVPSVQLRWMIEAPTKMTLDGISFRTWPEFEGHEQPNFLAILVLAWSYILSARLLELQGQDGSRIDYTRSTAPVSCGPESVSSFSVNLGDVDVRTVRWFTAILAPGNGFRVALLRGDSYSHHAPWESSLVAPGFPFSIKHGEGGKDLNMSGLTPLTSHEALQSLISLCNRYSVSRYQLHAALATALLLPTHNYLGCELALPRPEKRKPGFSAAKICGEDLDYLYSDLPYYITLSCGCDVINSSLCGVFWNPRIPGNLASPWLQPLWDLKEMQGVQGIQGRYAEVLALICAQRAPNVAFLAIAATISGLASKIWDQVWSGQPPLERHAFAWTGVPQSFMDIAGEGKYFEVCFSQEYIRRSDCWRLRKLPAIIDDNLHYGIGPFTPWAPAGYGLLKNCPMRVQIHRDCGRHAFAYEGSTWCFTNGLRLVNDLGRDSIIPHVFANPLLEAELLSDLPPLVNEETSIDATVASFRWVLDNGEGTPLEDAYRDPWLHHLCDTDSDGDGMSVDDYSSAGTGSRETGSSVNSCIGTKF